MSFSAISSWVQHALGFTLFASTAFLALALGLVAIGAVRLFQLRNEQARARGIAS